MQEANEKELNIGIPDLSIWMIDSDEKAGKWTTRKMDLRNLKKILTRLAERSSGYCMEQSLLGKS